MSSFCDGEIPIPSTTSRVREAGGIFVVDSCNHRVKILDIESKQVIKCIPIEGNLRILWAAAVHENRLLVSDVRQQMILTYDWSSGRQVDSIGSFGGAGELNGPLFMNVFTPPELPAEEHLLLICELWNKRLCVFNLTTGLFSRALDLLYRGAKVHPTGVVAWTRAAGVTEVCVSDSMSHRVLVFDFISGELIREIGLEVEDDDGGDSCAPGYLKTPRGLAIHRPPGSVESDSVLVVADGGNNRVQVFRLVSGEFLRILGDSSVTPALHYPCCVAVIGNCNGSTEVIVSCHNGLQVFDLYSGLLLKVVGGPGRGSDVDSLNDPRGLFVVSGEDDQSYILK